MAPHVPLKRQQSTVCTPARPTREVLGHQRRPEHLLELLGEGGMHDAVLEGGRTDEAALGIAYLVDIEARGLPGAVVEAPGEAPAQTPTAEDKAPRRSGWWSRKS